MTKTQTTQALADLRALTLDLRTMKTAQDALKRARKERARGMLTAEGLAELEAFWRPAVERAAARVLESCAALAQGGLEGIPETAAAIAERA